MKWGAERERSTTYSVVWQCVKEVCVKQPYRCGPATGKQGTGCGGPSHRRREGDLGKEAAGEEVQSRHHGGHACTSGCPLMGYSQCTAVKMGPRAGEEERRERRGRKQ